MADDHIFLLPVAIDEATQAYARVPEKFLTVQWLRVPGGQPTATLEALCHRLVSGESLAPPVHAKSPERPAAPRSRERSCAFPAFPREEPGQKIRFLAQVVGWSFQSAWVAFKRLPAWLRIFVYFWVAIFLLSRGCSSPAHHSTRITPEQAKKLEQLSDASPQDWSKEDVANFVAQVTKALPGAAHTLQGGGDALLAIPFSAPLGDPAAQKFASSAFAQVYGRIAIARDGHVGLTEPPATLNSAAAADLGRAHHSSYVIYGAVDGASDAQALRVNVVSATDGSIAWSQTYPVAGADPARIASDVVSNIPSTEDK
jgi:TolB-like protein